MAFPSGTVSQVNQSVLGIIPFAAQDASDSLILLGVLVSSTVGVDAPPDVILPVRVTDRVDLKVRTQDRVDIKVRI